MSKSPPPNYRRYYAINFDLSIENLETYYSSSNPKDAYREIKKYMKSHGFHHRQFSGYVSDSPMSANELLQFNRQIHIDLPWLYFCEEKFDATIISAVFDLKQVNEEAFSPEEMEARYREFQEKKTKFGEESNSNPEKYEKPVNIAYKNFEVSFDEPSDEFDITDSL